MNREQKAAVVEELAEQIRSAEAIFAVDYRGISVSDAADLRSRLRDSQTKFRVVKNSLTERATDEAGTDVLKPMLEGPTALAFVSGDAALAAKALNDAARALGTLEFKGGLMNGTALSADEVRSIARLPARDVLHGQLVGTIAAPLSGLVRTLNALIAGLAIQLQQVAEQGLVGTDAPSASEAAGPQAEASPGSEAEAEASPGSEAAGPQSETDEGPAAARAASDADDARPEQEAEAPAEVAEEPASEPEQDETETPSHAGASEE